MVLTKTNPFFKHLIEQLATITIIESMEVFEASIIKEGVVVIAITIMVIFAIDLVKAYFMEGLMEHLIGK